MALSVPELLRAMIAAESQITDLAHGGVVVGQANENQIAAGVVEVSEAGYTRLEYYAPIVRARTRLDVLSPDPDQAEQIKSAIIAVFEDSQKDPSKPINRRVVRQGSTDEDYLVHFTHVIGGPHPRASTEVKTYVEYTVQLDAMIGTEALVHA